jgi:uncharacterized protein
MVQKREGQYTGAMSKISTFDFTYDDGFHTMPIIIFCHGFKGFKDWGGFNYIANYFASKGFGVFKLNFSHNGTSLEDKENFVDLDGFSINTLGFEMGDLEACEAYIKTSLQAEIPQIDASKIGIIGHSKGGVSALLYCAHYKTSISKICSWASPFDFFRSWSSTSKKEWKEKGMLYILNGRTRQQMPLSVDILNDYEKNIQRYNVAEALKKMSTPILIIHGSKDESVPISQAHELKKVSASASIKIIENANHTFGMQHPFDELQVPSHLVEVLEATVLFFKSQ